MSDSDEELFGVNMAGLADAMKAAGEDDDAATAAEAEYLRLVEALIGGVSKAVLTGDDAFLEAPIKALADGCSTLGNGASNVLPYTESLGSLTRSILSGNYGDVLRGGLAQSLVAKSADGTADGSKVLEIIRHRALERATDGTSSDSEASLRLLEIKLVGVAALHWFLQANYTGPELTAAELPPCPLLSSSSTSQALCVDGEIPYSGSTGPEMLLLARSLLAVSADPSFPSWTTPVTHRDGDGDDIGGSHNADGGGARGSRIGDDDGDIVGGTGVATAAEKAASAAAAVSGVLETSAFDERVRQKPPLRAVLAARPLAAAASWWSALAVVTHQRLLLAGDPTRTLWAECVECLRPALRAFAGGTNPKTGGGTVSPLAAEAWLELGLAQFHFGMGDTGKAAFEAARKAAALEVEVTGALGKRTKFQQHSHAQMIVKASSSIPAPVAGPGTPAPPGEGTGGTAAALPPVATGAGNEGGNALPHVEAQSEESILLERTAFDEEQAAQKLPREHLAVLLGLCLDVKNSNPADGLTTEEMRPYVERVLLHHKDWTIYSTALLQRAWIDFESYYSKDRATLQIQALVDQHGQVLTFTQLSRSAIEDSAPAQDRLRFLHAVVYPPRWELKKDLATRYQSLGVLVSASQIFQELELWDDVVDCYARMGKRKEALALVKERLAVQAATPRMLCALGDLSEPPESTAHYEEAWKLSGGRYARAKRSVGREAFTRAQKCGEEEAKERGKASRANANKPLAERTVDEAVAAGHAAEVVRQLEAAEAALGCALVVQPGITSDWFVLGTVRMRLEKWHSALTAFSTVVAHAPDSGDAWGNVGAIHLKLKRPDLALQAFIEGLKATRESWRMWENR